jgi:hypothetical protein
MNLRSATGLGLTLIRRSQAMMLKKRKSNCKSYCDPDLMITTQIRI